MECGFATKIVWLRHRFLQIKAEKSRFSLFSAFIVGVHFFLSK
jgi:hypothetical protein